MNKEDLETKINSLEAELSKLRATWPFGADEATAIKTQVAETLKSIGDSKIAADEEARRAARAKEFCEEHATAIGQRKGQLESDLSQIAAMKSSAEEMVRVLGVARTQAEELINSIGGIKSEFSQSQAWLAQSRPMLEGHSKAIEQNATASGEVLVEQKKLFSDTKQLLGEVEQLQKSATTLLEKITATQREIDNSNNAVASAKQIVEKHADAVQQLHDTVSTIVAELKNRNTEMLGHRDALAELKKEFKTLNDEVHGLLPHSAIASLASSFRLQKERFQTPQRRWLVAFGVSIAILILLALPGFLDVTLHDSPPADWGMIFRGMMMRLPILVPVVWFAIYAGKNYMLSVRLEEDYAYKEAISVSFQGYAREMQKIQSPGDTVSPVKTLCDNVLRAIAQPPGRIYDGKSTSYSVGEHVKDGAVDFKDKHISG